MEHPEAVHSAAVDKYLLGEFQAPDREAFEKHFFECAECFEQVRLGAVFQANARAVLREEAMAAAVPLAAHRRPWFRWNFVPAAAMAACAALAVVAGYQNVVVIPQLRRAAAGESAMRMLAGAQTGSVRGSDLSFSRKSGAFSLYVPMVWEEPYNVYTSELERRPGSQVMFKARLEDSQGDFTVLVPTAELQPGKYVLNVYGVRADGQKTPVARFPLTLTD